MNARSRDKERRPIGMADEQSYPVTSAPASGMQSTRVDATPEVQVSQPVETPVVAEEKAPVTPVQRRGPVQAEPQAVQSTETPQKKPYTWWWQTPDFVGAVESQAKAAEKRAEQDRKRARRERNAAILGDLAKLGAQMYAKNGGAWKIDPFTPATEKANDKLAALRERHAAEVAAFARQRAAAKQAQIADNNARMKLETSLAEADLDRRIKAEKDARDFAYKVKKDEFDAKIAAQNAEIAAQNAESRRISANASAGRASGGSGANNDAYKEYYEWLEKYPEIQVRKAVAQRDELGFYVKDKDGKQVYEYVVDENPSLNAVKNAIAKAKNLEKKSETKGTIARGNNVDITN